MAKEDEKEKPQEEGAQAEEQAPQLDPAWLKGLMVTDHVEKPVVKDGKATKEKKVAENRDAAEKDVLAWKHKGTHVVLVMKDGNKHHVKLPE